LKTEVFPGGANGFDMPTDTNSDSDYGTKTMINGTNDETIFAGKGQKTSGGYAGNRTVFGDTDDADNSPVPGDRPGGNSKARFSRKLVGWLVSYTLDELGIDYKIYEGRNIIGRDIECNITVNDGRMSGKHAVLLFRANKYSLTDSQSSHGTFVNDEDIELEPRYLKDGDIIRMGNTVFRFRTSLF